MNMHYPYSVEGAKLIADAHDHKDARTMNSSLLMLEIQANALEQERRNKKLMNDQVRLARHAHRNAGAGALMAVRRYTGEVLINLGERLCPEPATRAGRADSAMKA